MRIRVSHRVVFAMSATACLATVLAVLLQARTLSADLTGAARDRADRAAGVATTLLEQHQHNVLERHRAMARTPEFRANLATAHAPTLSVLARDLRERGSDIRAVVFTNRSGERVASNGDRSLVLALMDHPADEPAKDAATDCSPASTAASGGSGTCSDVIGPGRSFLLVRDGELMAVSSIVLRTGGAVVGRFVVSEAIGRAQLERWAALAGAGLALRDAREPPDELERVAVAIGGTELRVQGSFEAERRALANLYQSALAAGAVAIGFALVLAVTLSRALVRPIQTIERAAHRIRAGDWSTRLRTDRSDELGDVARAFDTMLDHVDTAHAGLRRAQRIGQLGGWSHVPGAPTAIVSEELRRILDLEDVEGVDAAVSVGRVLARVHHDDRADLVAALHCCEQQGRAFSIDHRVIRGDGSVRIVHTQAARAEGGDGSVCIDGIVQDVTERKRIEEEVRRLAYEDGLTGLGNRRGFGDALQRAIDLGRQQLAPLAVIFLDLDDFKVVNDTLGHSAGDRLLRTVADRIVDVVRDLEPEEAGATVHRLGGDEFAVLLPRLTAGDAPLEHAQNILESLARSVELDGYEVTVSASIGIARWPDEGEDAESLLQGCDTAMYHAKRQGRGTYRVYDASMRESVERRMQLESRLRGAIERGDLRLFYQPKVDLESGRVHGLDALLRWYDPQLGYVAPDEFIALAEGTGQILDLGQWALREAAGQVARWRDGGVLDLPIAVNVSSAQIDAEVLVATLKDILATTGLPPERLELEVTESALLRDDRQAIDMLHAVKRLGLSLALDDFGTGYSSLSYLRQLPIDAVKIDRSFVEHIADRPDDHALLGSIVAMAKVLGLRVVAEGVETELQRDLLAEMGCDLNQGYWYSAPVPADEVPQAIAHCESPAKRGVRRRAG